MKKIKKYLLVALVSVFTLTLYACGSSFEYDKDAAIKSAQELIEVTNTKDYQAVVDMLPENLRNQISADKLRDALDSLLYSSGAFVEYRNATTTGVTQNGVNYIVVVVPCKYEKNTQTFTITYTTDLKIAALEMK